MEKIGERLPTEILHSDSIGTDLVASYTKKFACSQERVIEREGTGLRKREYTIEVTQAKRAKLVSLATSTTTKAVEKGSIEELTSGLNKLKDQLTGFPEMSKLKKKPEFINALINA